MMDTILGQAFPATGKGVHLATHNSISRVPIERKVWRLNGSQNFGGFTASRGVAGELIFDDEEKPLLTYDLCCNAKFFVDGRAVGSYVIEPPEVETANLVRLELLRQRDAAFDHFILLLVGDLGGAMHVPFGSVLGFRGAGPVDFEQGACDVGDLQTVFGQYLLRFCYFGIRRGLEVLAPHLAELDALQPKVVRDDRACVVKVLRDFIGDNGNFEGRLRCRCHAKERTCRTSRYSQSCSCKKASS